MSGGKTPAVTVSQVRETIRRLLRSPAPSRERIAEVVSRVLWREEAARIDKWHEGDRRIPAAPLTTGDELNSYAAA